MEKELTTQITEVTVYSDRALITRHGKVTLESGVQELIVGALPDTIDVQSLRATGRGEVAVKIIGVEANSRIPLKSSNASLRELQEQLDDAQRVGSELSKQDEILCDRAETVKELSGQAAIRFAKSLSKRECTLEDTTQMLDFVAAELKRVGEEREALAVQKRENAVLQVSISSQINQQKTGNGAPERVIKVLVEAAESGEWDLELSYAVRGAKWQPMYDARIQLKSETGTFSLAYNALINQRSGEAWDNVSIKLSTAQPGRGTLPPKLQTIWIDQPRTERRESRPLYSAPRRSKSSDEEGMRYDSDVSEMLEGMEPVEILSASVAPKKKRVEAEEVVADITTEGTTVEFSLPHQLSIPSDGQPHRVSIATREFASKFDYLAIPRRIEVAYLRARITNDTNISLLAGEVNIFRDGIFVGRSNLPETAPKGEFTLFLGPDEMVRAKRELTKREADKNFIGSSKRIHFAYQIEVQNLKNHPVNITVQDQIPVSRSENIKVKLRGSQPEAQQNELGILTWEWTQGSGEKRVLRFDYGVEAPREMTIRGLND